MNVPLNKKFIKDFILNALSVGIPIVIFQLVIQPLIASRADGDEFGFMLVIISLVTMVSQMFGGTLNNVLLLNYKRYADKRRDFNFLFILSLAASVLLLVGFTWYYEGRFNPVSVLLSTVTGIFSTASQYYSAEYRIDLNYTKALVAGVFKSIGYGAGFLIFYYTGFWYAVLLMSAAFELGFTFIATKVHRYPYRRSDTFPAILKSFMLIFAASIAGSVIGYLDKLMIYPMFGGMNTSIYNAASVLSKAMALGTGPLASVLLSYLIRKSDISKNRYNKICLILMISCIPLWGIMFGVCKIGLPLLYPQFSEAAMAFIPYTISFSLFGMLISFLRPLVLVRLGEGVSLAYSVTYVAVYFVSTLVSAKLYGLTGFCIARCACDGVMAAVIYVMNLVNISKGRNKDNERTVLARC